MWRWVQRMVWSACPPPRRACRRSRSQRLPLRAAARRGCTYRPVSVVARAAQARWAVARVCCGRQATGVTPTVHKVRFSSERGRCVTHWRSDGTTPPAAAERVARARGVGYLCRGDKPGIHKTQASQATTRRRSTCGCSLSRNPIVKQTLKCQADIQLSGRRPTTRQTCNY